MEIVRVQARRDHHVAEFKALVTRTAAEALKGALVAVEIDLARQTAGLRAGEYFFEELKGLKVVCVKSGENLGIVSGLFETGPGGAAVLVVQGERGEEILLPYTTEIVRQVDLLAKQVSVSVPPDLLELNR